MYGLQFQAEQKSIHFGRAFLPTQFFTRCLSVFFCLASRTSSYTLVLIIKLLWFYINKLVDNA